MDCLQDTSPRSTPVRKMWNGRRDKKRLLPQKKRRRLELKHERLTQKGAKEAAEGDIYQSGTFISKSMFFHLLMLKCFLII